MAEGAGGDMIEIKPVKKAKAPKYPTRLKLLEDPSLLERRMPLSWSSNVKLAASLGFLLATGRFFAVSAGDVQAKASSHAIVAPIFEHGSGSGPIMTGKSCTPDPIFLPEDEALKLIADELSKAGLKASNEKIPLPKLDCGRSREMAASVPGVHDEVSKVAAGFISRDAYFDLRGPVDKNSYEMKTLAKKISSCVSKEDGDLKFGVFYDPISVPANPRLDISYAEVKSMEKLEELRVKREAMQEKARREAIEESKRLLREQVKDFVEWLKAQGAI